MQRLCVVAFAFVFAACGGNDSPQQPPSGCNVIAPAPTCPTTLTYPPAVNLSSVQYPEYAPPVGPVPGYLETFNEPINNHVVRRISDKVVFGTTAQNLRHNYSKDQTWNADGSLVKLAGFPAAILDGRTYEFISWNNIPSYGRWSNTQPKIIFGTPSNRFAAHDVTTNQTTTLRTFDQFTSIDFGYGEGNQSDNDRYVGLIGKNGNNQTLFVYDIQNDTITGSYNAGDSDRIDWFSVSAGGEFAVLNWFDDGPGEEQGTKVFDIDMSNKRHVADISAHGDLGYDSNGDDVLVSFGGPPQWDAGYYLQMVRLRDGLLTPLFSYPGGIWGGHISTRNTNRPGWAYVSENCCPDNDVAAREIFAIKLDTSNTIERYATHHTNAEVGNGGHSAMAVVNRDGTKVLFASNWSNSTLEADPYAPSWVVEVPQDDIVGDVKTNANLTVCPGAFVTLSACGAASYEWSTGDVSPKVTVQVNETTTYTVTGNDTDGEAFGSTQVTVTVSANGDCQCASQ